MRSALYTGAEDFFLV